MTTMTPVQVHLPSAHLPHVQATPIIQEARHVLTAESHPLLSEDPAVKISYLAWKGTIQSALVLLLGPAGLVSAGLREVFELAFRPNHKELVGQMIDNVFNPKK